MTTPRTEVEQLVVEAARPIPLLWPLSTYVVANPLWDLRSSPFHAAVRAQQRLLGISGYPQSAVLADAWSAGRIGPADLAAALDDAEAATATDRHPPGAHPNGTMPDATTRLEAHDRRHGTSLTDRADEEVSRWCAAFAAGTLPAPRARVDPSCGDFYGAWREVAAADPMGRRLGLAPLVARLGARPAGAVASCLDLLGLEPAGHLRELTGQLMRQMGWAAYAKWRSLWAAPEDPRPALGLVDYVAVRLVYDVALLTREPASDRAPRRASHPRARRDVRPSDPADVPDPSLAGGALGARLAALPPRRAAAVWLAAYEHHYRDGLLAALDRPEPRRDHDAPVAQVVCCIDVRAEGLRRHLEARGRYQTFGAAGFFGVPARVRPFGSDEPVDLCPVLVRPTVEVELRPRDALQAQAALTSARSLAAARDAVDAARESTIAPFLLAEAMGMGLGPLSVLRTAAPRAFAALRRSLTRFAAPEPLLESQLSGPDAPDAEAQARHAEAALRSIGLTDHFARVVVICGHGSTTENNAYGSALDCGACGAARGGTSARLAAAVLNREPVRRLLAERGIAIPKDTLFVAAEHDTATDAVTLFPPEQREPEQAQLALLETLDADLTAAGRALAAERSATLPGAGRALRRRHGARHVATRSADWAQVQPEWGLARNAALVVAPRRLTHGVDLGRRVFLHSYDPDGDPDGTTLEAILSGPMVVAHWISAAYYFSTVDPETLGAGDKAAHNIVAGIGVSLGADGDLRLGLPYQAVYERGRPYHEPMRLFVIVEAPRQRIDVVLARNGVVADLVQGGWVHVVARDEGRFWIRGADPSWRLWEPTHGPSSPGLTLSSRLHRPGQPGGSGR